MLRLTLDRGEVVNAGSQERRGSKGIIKPTVTRPVRVQGEAVLNILSPAEFLVINLSFVKSSVAAAKHQIKPRLTD